MNQTRRTLAAVRAQLAGLDETIRDWTVQALRADAMPLALICLDGDGRPVTFWPDADIEAGSIAAALTKAAERLRAQV